MDREAFSDLVTDKIRAQGNIDVIEEEVTSSRWPCGGSDGPLTSQKLSEHIRSLLGEEYLSFFDAAAPIVTAESLNMERCFFAARYDRGGRRLHQLPL